MESEVSCKYINYILDTTEFIEYAVSNSKGINLPRVSEKIVGEYEIDLPTIAEQNEIVNILDNILEKEKKAQELSYVTNDIEKIKKIILAKAFRGELISNIEVEESAIELLEKIILNKEEE